MRFRCNGTVRVTAPLRSTFWSNTFRSGGFLARRQEVGRDFSLRGVSRPGTPNAGLQMTIYRFHRPESEFGDFGEVEVANLHSGNNHLEGLFPSGAHRRAHLTHVG